MLGTVCLRPGRARPRLNCVYSLLVLINTCRDYKCSRHASTTGYSRKTVVFFPTWLWHLWLAKLARRLNGYCYLHRVLFLGPSGVLGTSIIDGHGSLWNWSLQRWFVFSAWWQYLQMIEARIGIGNRTALQPMGKTTVPIKMLDGDNSEFTLQLPYKMLFTWI